MPRDKETTYRIMSAIKSKNTSPERILGKCLWERGLRYRKHYRIKGKPDFVFVKAKVAVFCDGDFWHGNNWRLRGMKSMEEELSHYSDFWASKIRRNVARDRQVNEALIRDGWTVFRFWESKIKKNSKRLANKIAAILRKRNVK